MILKRLNYDTKTIYVIMSRAACPIKMLNNISAVVTFSRVLVSERQTRRNSDALDYFEDTHQTNVHIQHS